MFNLVVHERGSEKKYIATKDEVSKPRLKLVRDGVVEYIKTKQSDMVLPEVAIINNGTKHYLESEVDIYNYENTIKNRRKIQVVNSTLSFKKLPNISNYPNFSNQNFNFRVSASSKKIEIIDKDDNSIVDSVTVAFPDTETIYNGSGGFFKNEKMIFFGVFYTYVFDVFTKNVEFMKNLCFSDKNQTFDEGRLIPEFKYIIMQGNKISSAPKNIYSPCIINPTDLSQIPLDVSKANPYYYKTLVKPCLDYENKLHILPVSYILSADKLISYDLINQVGITNTSAHGMNDVGKMIVSADGSLFCFPYWGKSTTQNFVYKKNGDGSFTNVANLAPPTGHGVSNTNVSVVLGKDGWFYSVSRESKWLVRFNPLNNQVEYFDLSSYGLLTTAQNKDFYYTKNQDLMLHVFNANPILITISGAGKNLSLESPFFKY